MIRLTSDECNAVLHDIKLISFRRYQDHVYFYWYPLFRIGWKEMFVFEEQGSAYAFMYCVGTILFIVSKKQLGGISRMLEIAKGFWIFNGEPTVEIQVI